MPRLRIGLLTDDLQFEGTYQDQVWRIAADLARRLDFDLLVIPGHGSLQPGNPARGHLPLYHLAISAGLDGLVLSPTATFAMSRQELDDVLASSAGLPKVTFAQAVPGVPVILIDNCAGTADLIEHLIQVHGKKRIAMMRAPETHPEAKARYEAWKQTLARHGLPNQESMTVMGDFELQYIEEQIGSLLAGSGGFDALFCVNDRMAIAAMDELRRRGLKVPEDVAVCGYDDIGRGLTVSPPLTTVHQPVVLQVARAFEVLIGQLKGKVAGESIELPSRLVVRGSCGCHQDKWTSESDDLPPEADSKPLWEEPAHHILARVLSENPPESEVLRLLHNLEHNKDPRIQSAIPALDRYVRDRGRSRLIALQNKLDQLISLERYFTISTTPGELKTHVLSYLDGLGIKVISLSLVNVGGEPGAAHVLEERPDGAIARPPGFLVPFLLRPDSGESGQEFSAPAMGPPGWWKLAGPGVHVALPLVAGDHWYGLMVANLDEENSLAVRGLQEQLASHFHRNQEFRRLMQQALDHELNVRVEQEKMRAMTTLVAGVAHEINTPLGNGILGISWLQSLTARALVESRSGKEEKETWHGLLEQMREAQTIIENGLMRVDRLVKTFKKVSTSDHETTARAFDLPETIRQILESLRTVTNDKIIHYTTEFPDELSVRLSQSALWEILQILSVNVATHAYPDQKDVQIDMALHAREPGLVVLEFSDHGVGIDESDLPRIFEPFFTTLSSAREGAGLGLHIVYNLVTKTLNGTIRCVSSPGHGAKFILEFPTSS